ncbi:UNVERIFIED_CONTAM: hypothetical protein FKN15_056649 [Acipenser sinensis]
MHHIQEPRSSTHLLASEPSAAAGASVDLDFLEDDDILGSPQGGGGPGSDQPCDILQQSLAEANITEQSLQEAEEELDLGAFGLPSLPEGTPLPPPAPSPAQLFQGLPPLSTPQGLVNKAINVQPFMQHMGLGNVTLQSLQGLQALPNGGPGVGVGGPLSGPLGISQIQVVGQQVMAIHQSGQPILAKSMGGYQLAPQPPDSLQALQGKPPGGALNGGFGNGPGPPPSQGGVTATVQPQNIVIQRTPTPIQPKPPTGGVIQPKIYQLSPKTSFSAGGAGPGGQASTQGAVPLSALQGEDCLPCRGSSSKLSSRQGRKALAPPPAVSLPLSSSAAALAPPPPAGRAYQQRLDLDKSPPPPSALHTRSVASMQPQPLSRPPSEPPSQPPLFIIQNHPGGSPQPQPQPQQPQQGGATGPLASAQSPALRPHSQSPYQLPPASQPEVRGMGSPQPLHPPEGRAGLPVSVGHYQFHFQQQQSPRLGLQGLQAQPPAAPPPMQTLHLTAEQQQNLQLVGAQLQTLSTITQPSLQQRQLLDKLHQIQHNIILQAKQQTQRQSQSGLTQFSSTPPQPSVLVSQQAPPPASSGQAKPPPPQLDPAHSAAVTSQGAGPPAQLASLLQQTSVVVKTPGTGLGVSPAMQSEGQPFAGGVQTKQGALPLPQSVQEQPGVISSVGGLSVPKGSLQMQVLGAGVPQVVPTASMQTQPQNVYSGGEDGSISGQSAGQGETRSAFNCATEPSLSQADQRLGSSAFISVIETKLSQADQRLGSSAFISVIETKLSQADQRLGSSAFISISETKLSQADQRLGSNAFISITETKLSQADQRLGSSAFISVIETKLSQADQRLGSSAFISVIETKLSQADQRLGSSAFISVIETKLSQADQRLGSSAFISVIETKLSQADQRLGSSAFISVIETKLSQADQRLGSSAFISVIETKLSQADQRLGSSAFISVIETKLSQADQRLGSSAFISVIETKLSQADQRLGSSAFISVIETKLSQADQRLGSSAFISVIETKLSQADQRLGSSAFISVIETKLSQADQRLGSSAFISVIETKLSQADQRLGSSAFISVIETKLSQADQRLGSSAFISVIETKLSQADQRLGSSAFISVIETKLSQADQRLGSSAFISVIETKLSQADQRLGSSAFISVIETKLSQADQRLGSSAFISVIETKLSQADQRLGSSAFISVIETKLSQADQRLGSSAFISVIETKLSQADQRLGSSAFISVIETKLSQADQRLGSSAFISVIETKLSQADQRLGSSAFISVIETKLSQADQRLGSSAFINEYVLPSCVTQGLSTSSSSSSSSSSSLPQPPASSSSPSSSATAPPLITPTKLVIKHAGGASPSVSWARAAPPPYVTSSLGGEDSDSLPSRSSRPPMKTYEARRRIGLKLKIKQEAGLSKVVHNTALDPVHTPPSTPKTHAAGSTVIRTVSNATAPSPLPPAVSTATGTPTVITANQVNGTLGHPADRKQPTATYCRLPPRKTYRENTSPLRPGAEEGRWGGGGGTTASNTFTPQQRVTLPRRPQTQQQALFEEEQRGRGLERGSRTVIATVRVEKKGRSPRNEAVIFGKDWERREDAAGFRKQLSGAEEEFYRGAIKQEPPDHYSTGGGLLNTHPGFSGPARARGAGLGGSPEGEGGRSLWDSPFPSAAKRSKSESLDVDNASFSSGSPPQDDSLNEHLQTAIDSILNLQQGQGPPRPQPGPCRGPSNTHRPQQQQQPAGETAYPPRSRNGGVGKARTYSR